MKKVSREVLMMEELKQTVYMIAAVLIFGVVFIFAAWYFISLFRYKSTDYFKVTHKSFFKMRFDKGNYGEYLCYRYLRYFEKRGAKFLYNCYLPREKGKTTEIDVLMIYKSGIYVLESKNYSGWIFGSEASKNWTQTLPGKTKAHKEQFYNPIMQNRTHIRWLKNIIGNNVSVYSIIVFSERCTLKKIDIIDKSIKVIKRNALLHTIKKIDKSQKSKLSKEEILKLYDKIYPYSQVDDKVKEKHIRDIKKDYQK